MAIIKFIPAKSTIRDNRSEDGGYYVATCNVCGTEFYPKRSNAKYCSNKCTVNKHRQSIADGEMPKKTASKKQTPKKEGIVLIGNKNVYQYLKKTHDTLGDREVIITELKKLKINGVYEYKTSKIQKISVQKYSVELPNN
jgi:CRISPR/Cas system-associated protein Cas10 (large subunit of type III CRISPR-Cas system)